MATTTSGSVYGATVDSLSGSNQKGRLRCDWIKTVYDTEVYCKMTIFFESAYKVDDDSNDFYADWDSSYATTWRGGSYSISGGSLSGTAWSSGTTKELGAIDKTYQRETSDRTIKSSARLTGVYNLPEMTYSDSWVIPALESYAVTYDENHETGLRYEQTKWHGEPLTLLSTIPTRTGYEFKGWGTSADAEEAAYEAGDSYTGNAALTLYAVWEPYELVIRYDANGGTDVSGIIQLKRYGGNINLFTLAMFEDSGFALRRTGWSFRCWNTASDGTGTDYYLGDIYADDSKITGSNAETTLYAQWDKKTYDIIFDATMGELGDVPERLTKVYGEPLILPSAEPVLDLWNFLGWSDDPSGNGVVLYNKGAAYTDDSPLIPDNQTITSVTLYASWELAYIYPTISNLKAVRSNGLVGSDIVDNDKGTHIHLTGDWSVDTSIQADAVANNLLIEYKVSDAEEWIEASSSNPNAQSGTIDTIMGNGTILPNESYYVRVTVTDWGGSKSSKTILPRQFRLLDGGNEGRSLGIGCPASDEDEAFDVALSARFHNNTQFATGFEDEFGSVLGNVPMKHISGAEDLDDYKTVGFYYCDADGYPDGTWNVPKAFQDISFALEVFYGGQDGEVIQRATRCHKEHQMVCQRAYYGDSWGTWQTISMNGQKVLWEGEKFMNQDQAVDLSDTPVSQQENGIVLVFSAFSEGAAVDYHWQFKFIPKYFATYEASGASSNKGVSVALTAKSFEYIGTKLLFINDSRIEGHESNQSSGTNNGISFNNAHWVLRYVLGC